MAKPKKRVITTATMSGHGDLARPQNQSLQAHLHGVVQAAQARGVTDQDELLRIKRAAHEAFRG